MDKNEMIELVKNAPEGATHYVPQEGIFFAAYINKDKGLMWLLDSGRRDEWVQYEFFGENLIKLDYSVLGEIKPINAATALYAFAGMLTSLKEPITFSEKHWAAPAADMVSAIIKANNIGGEVDFDNYIPAVYEYEEHAVNYAESAMYEKPVYTKAMSDMGVIPDSGMLCRVKKEWLFVGVNYRGSWVLESLDGGELNSFHSKDVKPIKTDQEKLIDEMAVQLKFLSAKSNHDWCDGDALYLVETLGLTRKDK